MSKRRIVGGILILIGAAVLVVYGIRSYQSFQQVQYIREQGLGSGEASVKTIQPWMTLQFVAAAYTVPETFLYDYLDIPADMRERERRLLGSTLADLNQRLDLGRSAGGNYPAIIDQVRAAVEVYRQNPVTADLERVEPWMSIGYLANSLGRSTDELFAVIDISPDGNAGKPLELLAQQNQRDLREIVDALADELGLESGPPRPPTPPRPERDNDGRDESNGGRP